MESKFTRRRLITVGAGAAALGVLPGVSAINSAKAADTKVRMATGVRATTQCMAWIGAEAGTFRKHGLEVEFPKIEVGGIEAARGLVRGDWDFSHTGTTPIAEEVLKGNDQVILMRNTAPHASIFVVSRREITTLGQLQGKTVGVLTDAQSGQTGIITRLTLEKAGVTASYPGLGTYQNIYKALAAGDIDAGALPIDLRFSGQRQYGWNAFQTSAFGVPSIFATTRKLVASNRNLVMSVVRGMVETIHLFKTRPDLVVPLLQRFLDLSDRKAAEDLHDFYGPLFPAVPLPSLSDGMQDLRDLFAKRYPAAQKLEESDIADSSFVNELDKSGYIQKLYAS